MPRSNYFLKVLISQKPFRFSPLNHIYSYILWHKVSSNIDQEVPQVYQPHVEAFKSTFWEVPPGHAMIIHVSYGTKHSVIMTRETGVRPPGVPTHGPPHLLHKRLTILELLRSLPINHKFSCFLWEESIHKHLLKSPSRACSAILHPIYFIKGWISGKIVQIFIPKSI